MSDQSSNEPSGPSAADEVAIDYIKTHDFHVIWADGAIGTITPNRLIHFALYAERQAIPRRQVFAIERVGTNVGRLGPESLEKRISRGSIVREMACDVFMTVEAAENLAKWLLERVNEANRIKGSGNDAG
jgi:hypothetical protein